MRAGRGASRHRGFEHVGGNIDEHRPGPPGAGQGERFSDRCRDIARIANQDVVFGDRLGDRADVGFLEAVGPHEARADLPRDRHDRHAVHERVEQTGDEIGCSRTARRGAQPDAARRPRVPAGRENGRGFVPDEVVADIRIAEHCVVERHDRAAWISENCFGAFAFTRLECRPCPVHVSVLPAYKKPLAIWSAKGSHRFTLAAST